MLLQPNEFKAGVPNPASGEARSHFTSVNVQSLNECLSFYFFSKKHQRQREGRKDKRIAKSKGLNE